MHCHEFWSGIGEKEVTLARLNFMCSLPLLEFLSRWWTSIVWLMMEGYFFSIVKLTVLSFCLCNLRWYDSCENSLICFLKLTTFVFFNLECTNLIVLILNNIAFTCLISPINYTHLRGILLLPLKKNREFEKVWICFCILKHCQSKL